MTDQVTARKTSAATSRQAAPRPSRIRGTEAALSPPRGAGAGASYAGRSAVCGKAPAHVGGSGAVAGGAAAAAGVAARVSVGTDDARSSASSRSASDSVRNSRWAVSPCRLSAQTAQAAAPGVIAARQSGQRAGSAKRLMSP